MSNVQGGSNRLLGETPRGEPLYSPAKHMYLSDRGVCFKSTLLDNHAFNNQFGAAEDVPEEIIEILEENDD